MHQGTGVSYGFDPAPWTTGQSTQKYGAFCTFKEKREEGTLTGRAMSLEENGMPNMVGFHQRGSVGPPLCAQTWLSPERGWRVVGAGQHRQILRSSEQNQQD